MNVGPTIASVIWLRGQESAGNAVQAISQCRYSVALVGTVVTFKQRTPVGQIAWRQPYQAEGISRNAAIAEIKLGTDRVWLAPVLQDGTIGALVEQTLQYSAFKDTHHPTIGRVVYQQRGFMTQQPPDAS